MAMENKKSRGLLWVLIIGYIVAFSIISINRYQTFRADAFDLGIFMQSFWSTINGKGLMYNTVEKFTACVNSHFAVHVSPILLVVIPFYYVSPHAETILVIQSIVVGLSAYSLFLFTKETLKNERYALMLVVLYLGNSLLHGINRYDFHETPFALPFIFLTAYYFEKGESNKTLLSGILVLLAKEDAGIALISLATFYLLRDKKLVDTATYQDIIIRLKNHRLVPHERLAFFLGVLGAMWIILTMAVLLLLFPGSSALHGVYYKDFPCLNMCPVKVVYFLIANLTLGFLTFLRPKYTALLTTLPWIEILTSCQRNFFRIGFQYPYMVLSLSMIAVIYTFSEFDALTIRRFLIKGTIIGITVSLLTTPVLPISSPLKDVLLVPPSYYKEITTHYKILDEVTNLLEPTDYSILTQNDIFPHLANRIDTYVIWTSYCNRTLPKTDIILFDNTLLYSRYNFLVQDYLVNYTRVYKHDKIEVWIRNDILLTPEAQELVRKLEGLE